MYKSYYNEKIKEKGLEDAAKWRYFETYANDYMDVKFNFNLGDILEALAGKGYTIILLTARSENIRRATARRINFNLNCKYLMLMRDKNDISPAHVIKKKHLKEIQEKYEVMLAIDDEEENLNMYSSNGLFVMKAI